MRLSSKSARARLLIGASAAVLAMSSGAALAQDRDPITIAPQSLTSALQEFGSQTSRQVMFTPGLIASKTTAGVSSAMDEQVALAQLLQGTGLSFRREGDIYLIERADADPQGGSAAGGGAEVDALIVTAQKREEDIQDVPIAISAFSQEDLETRQVAGGPDLITQIPNFSFTKTNFSGYSIQIRGIGTQAISATTDPAVAVAFNNTPFIRNRFFEQEFYDLQRVEVLRGPQGTLYGRNATAGVVNIISQKPKFSFEAKASADVGNYNSTRVEAMINFPLVEDAIALRLAGAWTKRDGYAFNEMTGRPIDGRDLWSTRASLRFEPTDWISANFIYEHFEEDDDRLRSGKQLCKKHVVTQVGHLSIDPTTGNGVFGANTFINQGCTAVSLYSPEAFQTPNGFSLPFFGPIGNLGTPLAPIDPYIRSVQSRDLRVIESSVEPQYWAKADVAELQVSIDLSDTLTLDSETAYSTDELFSLQDYNRFSTASGSFKYNPDPSGGPVGLLSTDGVFCDPQLGCSDRLLLVDISTDTASQFSQEFRLGSNFDGPFNFSVGANYLRYDTEAKYYVFVNTTTLLAAYGGFNATNTQPWVPGVSDNSVCMVGLKNDVGPVGDVAPIPSFTISYPVTGCTYIDPNPIGALNDEGRNYFLSRNPYKLISYAAFGEAYYELAENLKITAGLRWTVDRKTAPQIPSWLLAAGPAGPYPTALTVFQEWSEPTGRLAIDWKPVLSFTDETLLYASYAHGYKAGGANPPPPVLVAYGSAGGGAQEILPETFEAEYVDAFEIGTKNTLLDGALTLNLTGFYYDYRGYQVSEIRNRSAVNSNYDSEVWGIEVEADWRPTEALRLGFKGGYQDTRIADGEKNIDLMDRTAGNPGWMVVRPFPTVPSNCILPIHVLTAGGAINGGSNLGAFEGDCVDAYYRGNDPITGFPYDPSIVDYSTAPNANGVPILGPAYADYHGFDPSTAPNGGRGFDKELGGNELPNAPNYTVTLTADYTLPLAHDWLMNLHADYHWQSESWWRVFNSDPFDRIEGFSTVNLAAIFTNEDAGWKVMAYVKNATDETAITGAFLNSDDTGLTTNVFLTEPRLYGVRVSKEFSGDGGWILGGGVRRPTGEPYPLQVEFSAATNQFSSETEAYAPAWMDTYASSTFAFPLDTQDRDLDWGDTRSLKVTYAPAGGWRVSGAYLYGNTNGRHRGTPPDEVVPGENVEVCFYVGLCPPLVPLVLYVNPRDLQGRSGVQDTEEYTAIDFMVGKEIGIGTVGEGGESVIGAGVRYAEFNSTSDVDAYGVTKSHMTPGTFYKYNTSYLSSLVTERTFKGVGPTISWQASQRLLGVGQDWVALDWTIAGGVLFGERTMRSVEDRLGRDYSGTIPIAVLVDDVTPRARSEDVTVPNLSLSLGLSYVVDRVKVSAGYSYDRFFDAIDGGYEDAEDYDRTIQGPFLKLSVGFGG